MKIKVEREKIVKAVKKLEGIELVLDDSSDAKEAIDLILRRTELFNSDYYQKLNDVKVTPIQEYKTSAVDYKILFLLDFVFEENVSLDTKAGFIKDLQSFFSKL